MYKITLLLAIIFTQQTVTAANDIDFKWISESYIQFNRSQISETKINPGNELFLLNEQSISFDQRLDFKLIINDGIIVFRPRWIYSSNHFETQLTQKSQTIESDKADITDFFYQQNWTSNFATNIGLQVYQWGPSEFLNSSNPFFHFKSNRQSLTYKEKGQILLRFNYDLNSQNNLVLILQPVSNNDLGWLADQDFKPQAAIKYEIKSKTNSLDYLGAVIGKSDNADFFVGEYGQIIFENGISLYADIKHTENQLFQGPSTDSLGFVELTEFYQPAISTLGILGLRYENDFDFRFEYIHNSIGLERKKFESFLDSIAQTSVYQIKNFVKFERSGLELLTKDYIYLSMRKSNLFNWNEFNVYLRSITALMDTSGLEQIEIEKNANDSMNVFSQFSLYRGKENSEFRLSNDWSGSIGFKIIF